MNEAGMAHMFKWIEKMISDFAEDNPDAVIGVGVRWQIGVCFNQLT